MQTERPKPLPQPPLSKFQNPRDIMDKDRKWMEDGQKSKVELKFVAF